MSSNILTQMRSKPRNAGINNAVIDYEKGTIKNVVLCEVGQAKGHDVSLEQYFIDDLVKDANANQKDGLKCRFGHPSLSDSTMGTQLGYLTNIRVDGTQAKGDLQLLEASKNGKNGQNLWQWTLEMAKERPDFIMSSIVFMQKNLYQYDEDNNKRIWYGYNKKGDWISNEKLEGKTVFVSLQKLLYSDLVEQGAATNNLFSDQNLGVLLNPKKYAIIAGRFATENPEIVDFLKKNPNKLVDFAEKLGVKLPVKNTFSSFIMGLFSQKGIKDVNELERQITTKLQETFNDQLKQLEQKKDDQITALEKDIEDKKTLITELEKRPKTAHTTFQTHQNLNKMSNVPQIFGSSVNKRAVQAFNKNAKIKGLAVIEESTAFAPFTDDAATYQDHTIKHREEILTVALEEFRTRNAVTAIPAVKGKMTVTEQLIGNIVKKWKPLDLDTAGENISLKPHDLISVRFGFHEKITPAALEGTYLAHLRQTGQNPMDFPFEAYVMDGIRKKITAFIEKVFWQGKKDPNSEAGIAQIDGILEQLKQGIAANKLTETTLGTPVVRRSQDQELTAGTTGTVEVFENLIQSAPDALLDNEGLQVYCRRKIGTNYGLEHRNLYKSTPPKPFESFNVEGFNANANPLSGINTDRILATPVWNIIYGYDAETDISEFKTQYILNQLHIFGAFRIAAKLLIIDDRVVLVNEKG